MEILGWILLFVVIIGWHVILLVQKHDENVRTKLINELMPKVKSTWIPKVIIGVKFTLVDYEGGEDVVIYIQPNQKDHFLEMISRDGKWNYVEDEDDDSDSISPRPPKGKPKLTIVK